MGHLSALIVRIEVCVIERLGVDRKAFLTIYFRDVERNINKRERWDGE